MKKPAVPLLGSSRTLDAHQELAAAVIKQALIDAMDPSMPERVRAGARTFLAGSPMLRQWCRVAGLELSFLEAKRRTHRARAFAQPTPEPVAKRPTLEPVAKRPTPEPVAKRSSRPVARRAAMRAD